jgi:hypothetical protein
MTIDKLGLYFKDCQGWEKPKNILDSAIKDTIFQEKPESQ